ncbi:uncharacterized protein I206_107111 [Kwoniella pini CBS 10737]|uniref:Uncharacterized protein n=1 Tax=Kwoniella pini CBS 10737 TaxID=1296096 RepID=A0A1B9HZ72_9TREE|nr:uncharacterized protein I206_05345 [Kwoniella pini CBS 10737]OCF48566.1 hypothetical protein I206_05345 [Kwoniella pini CBS 10737]
MSSKQDDPSSESASRHITTVVTPSVDPKQIAFEIYINERWGHGQTMKDWPKEYPVFWEGAGPIGLGRERDERDS